MCKGIRLCGLFSKIDPHDVSRAARYGAPPWKLDWADAIDEAKWDGAWPNFWRTNLIGRSQETYFTGERDFADENESECWETPPESESDLTECDSPAHATAVSQVPIVPGVESLPMFSLPSQ